LESYKNGGLPDIEITAVCDVDESKFKKAHDINPAIPCFTNATELMASGLCDAVAVATPHYYHPPMVIEALEHGLHVLSEKPAGVYTKQVRQAIEAAAKSDKTYAMMFNQRTNPLYIKVRELVKSGVYGKMMRMNWVCTSWYRTQAYYDSGTWRATWSGEGGGVMLNQCPHQLDLWQWICGMPTKIAAFAHEGMWHNIEVEDDVTIYAEYADGATGTFVTSTGEYPGTNRLEITMEKAKIVCEGDSIKVAELTQALPVFTKEAPGGFDKPKAEWKEIKVEPSSNQHEKVLAAFAGHILRGEALVAEGPEGINGLMISNAAFLSSWLGRPVDLPVDEDLFWNMLQEKIKNSTYQKTVNENVIVDMSSSYKI